jgi:hypothetical protein
MNDDAGNAVPEATEQAAKTPPRGTVEYNRIKRKKKTDRDPDYFARKSRESRERLKEKIGEDEYRKRLRDFSKNWKAKKRHSTQSEHLSGMVENILRRSPGDSLIISRQILSRILKELKKPEALRITPHMRNSTKRSLDKIPYDDHEQESQL